MKKIFVSIVLIISMFVLSACGDSNITSQGTTPVYQGMELNDSLNSNLSTNSTFNPMRLSSTLNETDIIDEETIIDLSENLFNNLETNVLDYYASVNENLYLTVHISNPDKFEILSFTLNGEKYQSYQFEDGSDSEKLILEVNSGDVSGITEFTIDQIKYVEGTDIRDVIIDGNETIQLGVTYLLEPTATITNEVIGTNSITIDISINDIENVLNNNLYNLIAVLYDGSNIVENIELILGDNQVVFNNLPSGTSYQYAILVNYDLLNGNGNDIHSLESNSFTTTQFLSLNTVVPTQDSVSFNIDVTDVDTVGAISAIELYQGETLIEALTDLSVREFTSLLSDNAYTIQVTYTYDLNDGLGEQTEVVTLDSTTIAKTVPTVEINTVVPTQDSVAFNIDVTDEDSVGTITAIELYQGEMLIEALTDLSVREFTNLNKDSDYEILIEYVYDLNDGFGEHDEIYVFPEAIHTKPFNGSGTEDDPYWIYSIEDFMYISAYPNANYVLMNNVDLADYNLNHINTFYGVFDGNGYELQNYNVNINEFINDTPAWGIIGTNYGMIKNLQITNISIVFENTGPEVVNIGSVVGENRGTISGVYVAGIMNVISQQGINVGGLVGHNYGVIENSYSRIDITLLGSSFVVLGGITGYNNGGIVNNSYYFGDIVGSTDSSSFMSLHIGGVAGDSINGSTIEYSLSRGKISFNSNNNYAAIGGLVGETATSIFSNSYSEIEISGIGTPSNVSMSRLVGSTLFDQFENIYYLENQILQLNDTSINEEIEMFNIVASISLFDILWYTDTLGFDDTIWDLSSVEIDGYPSFIDELSP